MRIDDCIYHPLQITPFFAWRIQYNRDGSLPNINAEIIDSIRKF